MTNLRNPNARMVDMSRRLGTAGGILSILTEVRQALLGIWELVSIEPVTATADYEVSGKVAKETVICTNTTGITVTLQSQPKNMTEVIVKMTSGAVTVSGNGKTIDGSATQILSLYNGMHIVYTDAAGEWSII